MISFVVAITKNYVMARDGRLPWHLKTDKEYYRNKARGHVVVMGSTTFAQVGTSITDREIIVLTRDSDYHPDGVTVVRSIEEALPKTDDEVMVLGGGQVFAAALPYADRMYITEIDIELQGNVYFPKFNHDEWHEVSREHHVKDADNEYDFDFVVYDCVG